MKREMITTLIDNFELHAQQTESGMEYWLACELQYLLGYEQWQDFAQVISEAKYACKVSENKVLDHFTDIGKMVDLGTESKWEIDDMILTPYACDLIAQNGDLQKEQITFAQTYFAMQTHWAELIEQHLLKQKRFLARENLAQKEKKFAEIICEQAEQELNSAIIRSKGNPELRQVPRLRSRPYNKELPR